MTKYWLLLKLVLLSGLHSAAQDCNCPVFENQRKLQRTAESFSLTDALKEISHQSSPLCKARYQEWLAESYTQKALFDSAADCLEKSAALLRRSACEEPAYYHYYRQLSALYYAKGAYPRSVEYSLKLLPLAEAGRDPFELGTVLLQLSQTFNKMKESSKGLSYARQALPLLEKQLAPLEKAGLLSRASTVYLWCYQDSKIKSLLDTARMMTLELLDICRKNRFSLLLQKGYNMMNGYAHESGDYKTALAYIDSSFQLALATGDISRQATNYGDKADILMEMGKFAEARRLADSCLALHKKTGNPETIANAYALIYQISTRTENYKDALNAMENYYEIQDSLTNVEKSRTINELEQKYNKARNEKTIRELAQQKRIYVLLAAAGLFALLGLLFFFRQQSLKNKQKILETEQRLNRARMNPHFFFNALSSLQGFALEGHDGKSIASNLSKFSHIMRETLESTYKEYVTVEQETDFLREYLELQKIRFPQKFTYEIGIDPSLEPHDTLLPSMILQPFVENSIEHGFTGIGYPGHLSVQFSQKENELLVTVTDNGKGLSGPGKENPAHISRASQIIKDRIYLLNAKLKTKAFFVIDKNSEGKGVSVTIHLPLLYRDAVN